METIVIYYSWSGHAKALAEAFAATEGAETAEIKDARRPGVFKAYTAGCFAAMKGKAWKIQPLTVDLSAYDGIVLYSPVWAGNAPPAVNAILELLPGGKSVSVRMVSGGGTSKCRARIEEAIKLKGSALAGFEDIKG